MDTTPTELPKEDPQPPPASNSSLCSRMKQKFSTITLEPVVLCFVMPAIMASLTTQNLSLEKACRVNLRFPKEACDALAVHDKDNYTVEQELEVQKLVASMVKYKNICQSVLPGIVLLFAGSWSDRHQCRKPFMILPILGEVITCAGFLVCTYWFDELPLQVNIAFEAIPPALCGGWFVMFMAIFSYITSITSTESRTVRIGAVNVVSTVSLTMGMSLSGIMYRHVGYYGVYSLSLLLYCTAIVYIIYNVVDHKTEGFEKQAKKDKVNFFVDFFNWKHVLFTIKTVFKNDKRKKRARLICIMVMAVLIIGPVHGELSIMYLFTRHKFQWNEIDYSMFTTFHFILTLLGVVFSLSVLSRCLGWDDAVLGIVACLSKIFASVIYSVAPNRWIYYAGAIVEMLSGVSFTAMRSIISKLVGKEDIGKANSMFSLAETMAPFFYGPMYGYVYRKTIDSMPGAFYLVGASLLSPSIIIFYYLYGQNKIDKEEEAARQLVEEEKLLTVKQTELLINNGTEKLQEV